MKESEAAKRAKERLTKLDAMIADNLLQIEQARTTVERLTATRMALLSHRETLEYIVKGESEPEPTPAPRRTRKSRKPETDTKGVTTIKGTWTCHHSGCDNEGKTFEVATVLAAGRKAHKPLCPECMEPAEGEADVPDGARG